MLLKHRSLGNLREGARKVEFVCFVFYFIVINFPNGSY